MTNTLILFDKIFTTRKKYTTRLNKKEYIELKESGKYDIVWCYDRFTSLITPKGSGEIMRDLGGWTKREAKRRELAAKTE